MKKVFLSVVLAVLAGVQLSAQQVTPFKEGDRAVFLGNSITDGGHYHSYIWLYYMTRFPDMNITIFNAGIGGDSAPDMYKRLDGDVFSKRPTVLMMTFGMNDSGYFEYNGTEPEKFADKKVKECFDNYQLIEKRLKALPNTKIVMIGTSPYDEKAVIEKNVAFKNKNQAMLRIIDFQKASAVANKWEFVDFNQPMMEVNENGRKTIPTFTLCGSDRVHPDNDGHMVMAYLFLKAQGFAGKEVADVSISGKSVLKSTNCEITNLKVTSSQVSFNYLAGSLPYPLDTIARGWGSKRSQSKVAEEVPFMEEMNKELLAVKGLKANDKYSLYIDNQLIGSWSGLEFANGINLATQSKTPQYQQAIAIMQLNEERWEIERRFRDYAWMQFDFFQEKGLLFADNREALTVMDANTGKNGWLASRRDSYTKSIFPEIRQVWQKEMDLLVSTIYEINKPLNRLVVIKKVI